MFLFVTYFISLDLQDLKATLYTNPGLMIEPFQFQNLVMELNGR